MRLSANFKEIKQLAYISFMKDYTVRLRNAPPSTIAALIITMFFIMYCPSNVGAYGISVNTSDGKRNTGE